MATHFCSLSVILSAALIPLVCTSAVLIMTDHFTKDVTLTCNLTAFIALNKTSLSDISSLQIVGRTQHEETGSRVNILATLTTSAKSKSYPSPFLINTSAIFRIWHYNASLEEKENYFLSLLYTDVDLYQYGRYFCKVAYNSIGGNLKLWDSENMTFVPGTTEIQKQGSSLEVKQGLALTCTYTPNAAESKTYNLTVVRDRDNRLLVSWTNGKISLCYTNVICKAVSVPSDGGPTTVVVRVHQPDAKSVDHGTYTCIVSESGGSSKMKKSTSVEKEGCTTSAAPGPASAAPVEATSCFLLVLVVFMVY